ncbi:transposable element Tc1 transposase [Trichonephila clavipes]|nr:transposable element Tc1 transposase [Trichonephila clavipes]
MIPELAPSSPNHPTDGRTFELSTELTCIAPLHGVSLMVLDGTEHDTVTNSEVSSDNESDEWLSKHYTKVAFLQHKQNLQKSSKGKMHRFLPSSAVIQKEDFGKQNTPGKYARRHFSQLSEFKRGLIIGMKTAGWSTRRVAGQVDRSECAVRNCWGQWTREGTHAWKTRSGATRKTTRREDRRIVRQALVDPTVTRSTIRADVGVAIVPQTISRHLAEANLKSKCPFRALPLTPEHIGNCVYSGAKARSMWNVRLAKGCV